MENAWRLTPSALAKLVKFSLTNAPIILDSESDLCINGMCLILELRLTKDTDPR